MSAAAPVPRRTVGAAVELSGNAVRTHGGPVTVRLEPGSDGLAFWRADQAVRLPARLDYLARVPNATALGRGGQPELLFVEHILSACVGLGLTDAEIYVDGPEVPLFDGSALALVDALVGVGQCDVGGELDPVVLTEPLEVAREGGGIVATPADELEITYELWHAHPLIGGQTATVRFADFAKRVAPARTFATAAELAALAAQGLINGGSEENLLVIFDDRISAPLRSADEFALHKVLDLMGDLALLGAPLQARLVARRTGHQQNQELARRIAAQGGS